jgi:hypothetical protein
MAFVCSAAIAENVPSVRLPVGNLHLKLKAQPEAIKGLGCFERKKVTFFDGLTLLIEELIIFL